MGYTEARFCLLLTLLLPSVQAQDDGFQVEEKPRTSIQEALARIPDLDPWNYVPSYSHNLEDHPNIRAAIDKHLNRGAMFSGAQKADIFFRVNPDLGPKIDLLAAAAIAWMDYTPKNSNFLADVNNDQLFNLIDLQMIRMVRTFLEFETALNVMYQTYSDSADVAEEREDFYPFLVHPDELVYDEHVINERYLFLENFSDSLAEGDPKKEIIERGILAGRTNQMIAASLPFVIKTVDVYNDFFHLFLESFYFFPDLDLLPKFKDAGEEGILEALSRFIDEMNPWTSTWWQPFLTNDKKNHSRSDPFFVFMGSSSNSSSFDSRLQAVASRLIQLKKDYDSFRSDWNVRQSFQVSAPMVSVPASVLERDEDVLVRAVEAMAWQKNLNEFLLNVHQLDEGEIFYSSLSGESVFGKNKDHLALLGHGVIFFKRLRLSTSPENLAIWTRTPKKRKWDFFYHLANATWVVRRKYSKLFEPFYVYGTYSDLSTFSLSYSGRADIKHWTYDLHTEAERRTAERLKELRRQNHSSQQQNELDGQKESLPFDQKLEDLQLISDFLKNPPEGSAYSIETKKRRADIHQYIQTRIDSLPPWRRLEDFDLGLVFFLDINGDGNVDERDLEVLGDILPVIEQK